MSHPLVLVRLRSRGLLVLGLDNRGACHARVLHVVRGAHEWHMQVGAEEPRFYGLGRDDRESGHGRVSPLLSSAGTACLLSPRNGLQLFATGVLLDLI